MGEDNEHRHRIKLWMAGCLVVTAFSIDLFEMLLEWLGIGLIINLTTTPAVTLLFWIWFKLLNVPFMGSPKKFFTLFVTSFGELIPGLDALGGFLWTLGTIIIIVMVRAEDKGGILGKLSTAAMGIMKEGRRTGQFHRVSRDELTAVASGRGEEFYKNKQALARIQPLDKNQNTLNLRDKNPQAGKPPLGNQQQQQKQDGAASQSAGSQQEINQLKSDIERWKQEKQQLDTSASDKKRKYDEHEKFTTDMINTIKNGGADENRLKGLERAKEETLNRLWSDYNKDAGRIGELEKILWGANNKLIRLEQQAGTLKPSIAKS